MPRQLFTLCLLLAACHATEHPPTTPLVTDDPGCIHPTLAPGSDQMLTLQHDGISRQYNVFVSSKVQPGVPAPLVVNWHGLNSSAARQERYSGTAIVEQRGYVAVYPDGLGDPHGQSFNAGNCCSQFGKPPHHADDVGFGRSVVADIARRICVDKHRVYSTGMSNGGFMSEANACAAADLYAAVAPVSALGLPRAQCNPSRPIPILAFNGDQDPLVGYAASQQAMIEWAQRDDCQGEPLREEHAGSYCKRWTHCAAGVEVTACTVTGMGHCWPGNPVSIPGYCAGGGLADLDANPLMYDFFARFRLP